jgi:AraC-like DNA-binding protein
VLLVGGAAEATEAGGRLGLPVRRLRAGDDISAVLEEARPAAVVWDLADTQAESWSVISHLHDHALLRRTAFLVYGSGRGRALAEVIAARRPAEAAGPMVIADPDHDARARHQRLVSQVRPGHVVLATPDGTTALAMLGQDVPSVLVLAKSLPDMDAFDVLERLHGEARLQDVPAIVLSDTTVSADDVRRAEPHGRTVLVGSSILSEVELVELLARLLTPAYRTNPAVRHAVAYLHQHYQHPITRRQVAKAAGMSEDYLSRVFHRDLGVSPWDYLNRLRIQRAKERLRESDDSIQLVARRVGFHDRAYFSRIFRKLTGVPPQVYRDSG